MKIYGIWADGGLSLESSFVDDCFFLKEEDANECLEKRFRGGSPHPHSWFSYSVKEIEVWGDQFDWKMALAWYMHHVWHCADETYVRQRNGMNCMPPEVKAAIQEVERENESMRDENGRRLKPDGSVY